jgi:hypothetical protein
MPHHPVVAVVPQVRLHQTDVLCTVRVVANTKVSMMGIRITLNSSTLVAHRAVGRGRVPPAVSEFV